MRPERLAVPARDARKPVRDVLDLDVGGRGIEQIEAAPGQHALPGALCAPRRPHAAADAIFFMARAT